MSRIEELKNQVKQQMIDKLDFHESHKELVKELFNMENIWVALSKEKYVNDSHISIPLISTKDFDGVPSIYVFTKKEVAIEWAKHYNQISSDSEYYLVGKIEKGPCEFNSFYQLAFFYGAKFCLLDEGDNPIPIGLGDIFNHNGLDPKKIKLAISAEALESAKDNPPKGFRAEFVPISAIKVGGEQNEKADSKNEFKISEERGAEIRKHIFGCETAGEIYNRLMSEETLNENCYLYIQLIKGMRPMAKEKNDSDMLEFVDTVAEVLIKCIWDRLFKDGNVYLLRNEKDQPIREGLLHVAYTDFYKLAGQYKYHKIDSQEDIFKAMSEDNAKYVIITDGPNYSVPISQENFNRMEHWE